MDIYFCFYLLIARAADYPMDVTSCLMGILFLSTGLISLLGGYKYKWMTLFLGGFYTAGRNNSNI